MIETIKRNSLSIFIVGLLFIYLITSMFYGSNYNFQRVVFVICISSVVIYYSLYHSSQVMHTLNEFKYFFLVLLIPFIQSIVSPHINQSFEIYSHLTISIMYFLYFFAIVLLSQNMQKISLEKFLLTILIINAILFGFLLFIFVFFHFSFALNKIIQWFFSNMRFLNHMQTLFIPLLALLLFSAKNDYYKFLAVVFLVINFNFIFYTGARGSLLGIILAIIVVSFLNRTKQFRQTVIKFTLIFIVSLSVYLLIENLSGSSTHVDHLASTSSSGKVRDI